MGAFILFAVWHTFNVTGSFPIYEILESDGKRYLSWNPYDTGVIKAYDGTLASMQLLGFAIRTSDENPAYTYGSLDSIFNGLVNNYLPSGESLSARVNTTVLEKWRAKHFSFCLLYTSPSPRDKRQSRMPSSA